MMMRIVDVNDSNDIGRGSGMCWSRRYNYYRNNGGEEDDDDNNSSNNNASKHCDDHDRRYRRTNKTTKKWKKSTASSSVIVFLSCAYFCCLLFCVYNTILMSYASATTSSSSSSSVSSSAAASSTSSFSRRAALDVNTGSKYTSTRLSSTSTSPATTVPRNGHFSSAFATKDVLSLKLLLVGGYQLRGGGVETSSISLYDDEEEDDGGTFIMKKIRNIVRNIMVVTEQRKSPAMYNFFRSSFRTVEKLTGLKLLPKVTLLSSSSSSSKSKSSNKSKKNKSKKSKSKKEKKKNSEQDGIEDEGSKSSKPKSVKPQAVTSATKQHLTSSFTKSNPNHRIQKELKEFIKHPPDNLSVAVGKNIRVWIITIKGAKGSIYDGETFKLRVSFPDDYPTVPPSVYFLKGHIPKHEHIYTNGDICLSLLGKDWRPIMTAQSIAVSIQSILSSATKKTLPMDNAQHADNKPGQYQKDWVYHDDQC